MHNAQLVQILHSADDLLKELAGLSLLQFLLLNDVVEKFTSTDELHDQEQLLGCLNNLEELNDVGVPDQLQDVDLSRNSLHVGLTCDFALLKDFNGHLLHQLVRIVSELANLERHIANNANFQNGSECIRERWTTHLPFLL